MRTFLKIAIMSLLLLAADNLSAQTKEYDVIVPIRKYMLQSNADALSAWFADNLDIAVLSTETNASRSQARQITKAFFESYTPRSMEVIHTASRANMKYVLCNLNAGGEIFSVTFFLCNKGDSYKIQLFKVERR